MWPTFSQQCKQKQWFSTFLALITSIALSPLLQKNINPIKKANLQGLAFALKWHFGRDSNPRITP